jgi:peroxiredoxin
VLSPELPARTAAMAARHKLEFPILWDEKLRVAQSFGLAFSLPEDLKQVYLGFGNDLAVVNADPSWRLPVPARFVVDGAGVIRSVEADPDYRYRPEPETTLAALRALV